MERTDATKLRGARGAAQSETIGDLRWVDGVVFILWEIEIKKYDSLTVTWQNVTVDGNVKIRKHVNPVKMEISGGGGQRATATGARAGLTAYSDVTSLRNAA